MTQEPRKGHAVDLPLQVWGINTRGEHFVQDARAHAISFNGALLSGLDTEVKPGDAIGILYAGKKARYRVIWARYADDSRKIQAVVHCVDREQCPWPELVPGSTIERPSIQPASMERAPIESPQSALASAAVTP